MDYKYKSKKKIFCPDTGEHCNSSNYLSSEHWRKIRNHIYKSNNGVCERCGVVLPSAHMNVHHKTYKNIGNEQDEDLCLLCENCHSIVHGKTTNENGGNKKDKRYFEKKPVRKKKRNKTKKHTCNTCLYMKMLNKSGKVKYRCEIKNVSLTYSEKRICGKYENVYNAGGNPIKDKIKDALLLEIKDGKTIDQLNLKYGIAKKSLEKMI